jgi:cell fate regulator YaaT (PSP1 superfamily)
MSDVVLVRYGLVPEVARFRAPDGTGLERGSAVVVRTHRGLERGEVLDRVRVGGPVPSEESAVVRRSGPEDEAAFRAGRDACATEYDQWTERIRRWNLSLLLVDVERTLDGGKWILYVLAERGPDCTKLALCATAEGLGAIEVQPVGPDGPVPLPPAGGGCGSGGCGSGGCGSHAEHDSHA